MAVIQITLPDRFLHAMTVPEFDSYLGSEWPMYVSGTPIPSRGVFKYCGPGGND
jgi:hypothetical protein